MAFYDNYLSRIRDGLQDSPLVIELKSRYSDLDPKQQQLIAIGGIGLSLFIVLFFPLSLLLATHAQKKEIRELEEQTDYLNRSAMEIQELRQIIALQGQNVDTTVTADTPSREVATKYLAQANVREESATIAEGAQPSSVTISLSKISLIQLRKLLFSLENSPAGIDLTQVDVDTKSDPKGYMWSTIAFRKHEARKDAAAPLGPNSPKPEKKSFTR